MLRSAISFWVFALPSHGASHAHGRCSCGRGSAGGDCRSCSALSCPCVCLVYANRHGARVPACGFRCASFIFAAILSYRLADGCSLQRACGIK